MTTTDDADDADDTDTPRCYCQLTDVLDTLGRKYAVELLCAIGAHGTVRFGELETVLQGASTATLSKRLEELGEAGLVTRTQYEEIPPRVEYDLTAEGRDLRARLEPVLDWTVAHSESG